MGRERSISTHETIRRTIRIAMADVTILRPVNLNGAVPQNVDEYLREMRAAIVSLQNQIAALVARVAELEG